MRVRGLTKSFADGEDRAVVLADADFDAPAGEMTFLVGPSGCGKTTLLCIVAGIMRPDAGDVDVFGTRLGALDATALARFRAASIGFIFQQFNLLPVLTAVENVSVPLLIGGAASHKAKALATQWLDRLGLADHLHKRPAQLSGGQQQRVAIARALIHDPQLLVCDEPTSSLDKTTGDEVMALLREAAVSPRRAALIVTHDERILRHADRIAHMCDGRMEHVETAAAS